jgi:hypothetical protein
MPYQLPIGRYSIETITRDGKFLFWMFGILLENVLRKNAVQYVSANLLHFEFTHNSVHGNAKRQRSYMEENCVTIIPTSEVHKGSTSGLSCI